MVNEALANRLNLLPDRGPVKKYKKHSLFSSSLSFSVKRYAFLVEVWSRVTVTCQAFNAPTASKLVDPQLDRSRLLFGFLVAKVRNL